MKRYFLAGLTLLISIALFSASASTAAAIGTITIFAKALTSHECNDLEWHFVINQVNEATHAPDSIHVTWTNGSQEDVVLEKIAGGTAHYATSANLNFNVSSATAEIYADWGGQFNLSHGPCHPTAIELLKFDAVALSNGDVRVGWETGSESTILGFDIMRSLNRNSAYQRVNESTVEAKCLGQICGAQYLFRDKKTKSGKVYFYRLKIIHTGGRLTWSDIDKVKTK